METSITTIEQYISGFPEEIQKILELVRATIRNAAPGATEAIKYAIETNSRITDSMRDEFFEKLYASIEKELHIHNNLIVAQTFIKERFRTQVLKRFPGAKFILVKAYPRVREQRIATRATMPLNKVYARKMVRRFEKPAIKHQVIGNNENGKTASLRQFKQLKLS